MPGTIAALGRVARAAFAGVPELSSLWSVGKELVCVVAAGTNLIGSIKALVVCLAIASAF